MSARAVVAVLCGAVLLAGCATAAVTPALPDGTGSPAVNSSVTLSVLACEPLAWCVAGGTNPTASTKAASIEVSAGGRGVWAPAATPPLTATTLTAAGCWSSGCLLGGAGPSGAVIVIVNPAHKVAAVTNSHPPGSGVSAITCTAPGTCLALVSSSTETSVFETTDSGASWTHRSTLPPQLQVGTSISCIDRLECVVVGAGPGGATAARTHDGGGTWILAAAPHDIQTFATVSCGPTRWCLSTARERSGAMLLLRSVNAGASWSPMSTTIATPTAVSCTFGTTCIVGGGDSSGGAISTFTRLAHEAPLSLVYVPDPLIAVACATATKCAGITPASTVSFVA